MRILATLLLLSLSFFACEKESITPENGVSAEFASLDVEVVRFTTTPDGDGCNQPMINAVISLFPADIEKSGDNGNAPAYSVASNHQGRAYFRRIAPGNYLLRAENPLVGTKEVGFTAVKGSSHYLLVSLRD